VTGPRPKLRFFLDEGVADSVGRYLTEEGHFVIYLRDSISTGSADPLVCIAAEANDAILVAHDADMLGLVRKHGVTNGRFKRLSLVKLSCPAPRAVDRLRAAMSLIEHEWLVSGSKTARRIFIEIKNDVIRTMR
jgi:predicted nuclease of predicted toxin-antitoxin system